MLAELLRRKEVTIPGYSIFVGHESFQHLKSGCWGSNSLRNNTYDILTSYDLEDVVAFTYSASLPAVKQPAVDL